MDYSNLVLDDLLVYEDLAFSRPKDDERGTTQTGGWIEAFARAPFAFRDEQDGSSKSVLLNVEFFGDPSWTPLLLYVHGVCESAETWTVQNLVRICSSRKWKMAVLELEGHGLSEGIPGLLGGSWSKCVRQVTDFCRHTIAVDDAQKRAKGCSVNFPESRFALAGTSLGGALVAYASHAILAEEEFRGSFAGTLLISPAVGVDPSMVPPSYIVNALTVLSWMIPSVGIEGATPTEDPSHYNCPPWTQRNFKGPWPLGTSKMLLDVTSSKIPNDIESGSLNLLLQHKRKVTTTASAPTIPSKYIVVVVSGGKDLSIPIQAVRSFVDGMKAKAQEEKQEKTIDHAAADYTPNAATIEIIEIKKGDHGLLAQSMEDPTIGKTTKNAAVATAEQVNLFLKQCEEI